MSHDSKIFKQLHSQQVNVSKAFEKKNKNQPQLQLQNAKI